MNTILPLGAIVNREGRRQNAANGLHCAIMWANN